MRTIAAVTLLFLVTYPAIGQEEETLIEGTIESGGFGGPVVKIGNLNGETGVLVGGRGGWIINHSFILGGGGYGLATNVRAKTLGPNGERYLTFGYGGLELEYVPESNKLTHISIMTLIGAGGLGWRDHDVFISGRDENVDAFFVLEPAVNVTLNITTFFRISAGGSYRYITGLTSEASTNANLSGPLAVLTFRFGKF
jgi:hypothetical protein